MHMKEQPISRRGKIAIALCILASLGFFIASLVVYIRERDWPAKYVSAGVSLLAVMFIARRRRRARMARMN
jgi:uncharacterized membrane protein YfcA